MVVSLNYCSQNGGNLYRAPYYNGNLNIGPRIIGNLDQSPHERNPHVEGIRVASTVQEPSLRYPLSQTPGRI